MPSQFQSKIKATTAKDIAKGILSDKSGRKISDTKFKQILKQDKNLRKFAYTGQGSTLSKFKAKKFFNTVLESAQGNEKIKINKIAAKKMGLNINRKGQASQIGLNKVYQQAAQQEIDAQDTGPSPAEVKRMEKREKAKEKLRKQENISYAKEQQDKAKPGQEKNEDNKGSSGGGAAPPARQSGASGSAALGQTAPALNTMQMTNDDDRVNNKTASELPKLFMPPINNLSPTQPNVNVIAKKIDISIKQKMRNLRTFDIIGQDKINQALMNLRLDSIPEPADEEILKKIALETGAQLVLVGNIQKNQNILKINLNMVNAETGQKMPLADLEQSSLDLFDLENKLGWQINNSLTKEDGGAAGQMPSADQAIDLPI